MAQRVQVLLVCDMHGDDNTAGEETIAFALDGTSYEIDVCATHAEALRNAFAPFVGQARKTAGGGSGRSSRAASPRSTPPRGRAGADRHRTGDIRRWAREHGHQVPERGRLPQSIVDAYDAAH